MHQFFSPSPEVILCSWRDVHIQELTLRLSFPYKIWWFHFSLLCVFSVNTFLRYQFQVSDLQFQMHLEEIIVWFRCCSFSHVMNNTNLNSVCSGRCRRLSSVRSSWLSTWNAVFCTCVWYKLTWVFLFLFYHHWRCRFEFCAV